MALAMAGFARGMFIGGVANALFGGCDKKKKKCKMNKEQKELLRSKANLNNARADMIRGGGQPGGCNGNQHGINPVKGCRPRRRCGLSGIKGSFKGCMFKRPPCGGGFGGGASIKFGAFGGAVGGFGGVGVAMGVNLRLGS